MKDRTARWKRVGAFVKERRVHLGLSQNQVRHALGYRNAASVSLIEVGKEGVVTKRAYAWADVLEVPRDAFYRFVTGLSDTMELAEDSRTASARLSAAEEELIASYRRLPAKLQRRLREHAGELEILANAARPVR